MTIRAAWITSGFSADERDYRGAAAIHNLARGLSPHHEVDLTIFSFYYPVKKLEYEFYGAKVYSFAETEKISRFGKLNIWRKCMKKFGEVHSQNKFALIHAMWANEPGYIASKLSRRFSIPLLVNICGGELAELKQINYGSRLKYWQRKFVDNSFKHTNHIVYGSDYIGRKIMDVYPDSISRKSMKIPFGIDKDLFYSRSTRTNPAVRPELICISSAVPVKSHITMFRAIKILKDKYPDVMLKVYGRDDKDKLKRMVHELNLEKNIEIMGFTEYEKIPGVLNEADIFVSSSLYESQNMSLVEAAFCGLPVISTDTGVAREVTENIFKAGDAEQLASKIADVTGRYAQKKQEALNRLPMLHENFSLENVTSRYLELYKNTAGA